MRRRGADRTADADADSKNTGGVAVSGPGGAGGGVSVVVDVPCAGLYACLVAHFRGQHPLTSGGDGSDLVASSSSSSSSSGGGGGGAGGEEKAPASSDAKGVGAERRASIKAEWDCPSSAVSSEYTGPGAVTLTLVHGPRRARVFAWAPSPSARPATGADAKDGGGGDEDLALEGCLAECMRALHL